ncbi:MAG: hypothetical protein LUQ44_00785, partial [Methanothrix sp.]|nr:hypothetical protein [Methanothrix sp.]
MLVVDTDCVDGAAALAEDAVVVISAWLLSEAGGAAVLDVGEGAVIPRDSGVGGVVGMGWAHAFVQINIMKIAKAIIFFIFPPQDFHSHIESHSFDPN